MARVPDDTLARIDALLLQGLTQAAIRERTGASNGKISERKKLLIDAGKLLPGPAHRTGVPVTDRPVPMPARLPDPAPEAGGPRLPESLAKPLRHLHADNPGWWLVLGDTHFPMHDRTTIELAVENARRENAVGVLLNGDLMDMFAVSPFYREPSKEGLLEELECGRAALAWIRSRLPKARIIYREGNHDFRLRRYVVERGPALADLPELRLPNLLGLDKLGIEWVQDKAKVYLGKLITLHGHELRKGEGVNPARLAFLRTTATVLVSHHHRSSEHHQRGLDDRHHAAWSLGCACYIHPDYDPYNQWNHGYAMVDVGSDGWFTTHNRRVLAGRVV